jgi:transmembrane sensor
VGSVTSIALRDGSRVTLNTASRVHVSLNESERHVELEAGEAFFEVAHDATRPFVVTAGTRRIIAVGTRFSVRMEGDEVRVVVTEGKVRFERDENAGAELLVAGQTAHSTRNAILVQEKTAHDAETALSWRSGYLTFDETTLADAVAEFNRYTERKIRIADPKLAAIRINGKFRSSNADEFVELLRSGFGIHAEETADIIRLSE